jgi:hypothetical protein
MLSIMVQVIRHAHSAVLKFRIFGLASPCGHAFEELLRHILTRRVFGKGWIHAFQQALDRLHTKNTACVADTLSLAL